MPDHDVESRSHTCSGRVLVVWPRADFTWSRGVTCRRLARLPQEAQREVQRFRGSDVRVVVVVDTVSDTGPEGGERLVFWKRD